MSIRFKIATLYTALTGLLLIGTGIVVYWVSSDQRANLFRSRLRYRADATANAAAVIQDSNYVLLGKLDSFAVASLQQKTVLVLDEQGAELYNYSDGKNGDLHLDEAAMQETRDKGVYYFSQSDRKAAAVYFTNNKGRKLFVLVAAEDVDGSIELRALQRLLLWVVLLVTFIAFMAGLFFAHILVRPLRRMISEVDMISSNDLSQRIYESGNGDELNSLSRTFNNLLNRVQESITIHRRFISNASHELSTPLTSVSSQLEVTLQKDREPAEYKQVINSVYEDVKDLQQLTRSLLDIAKMGSQGSLELHEVRIDEVLMKVAAEVQKLKREYTVQLNFDSFPEEEQLLTVFGNADLLYIAFRNIVENGCKYSDNHTADMHVSFGSAMIEVSVKSKGDVILEADIQNIFQPFFRTDTVKHKEGSGLGLTLTKRIFALHKSTVEVVSNPGTGTIFTITLPVHSS